jgi:hypothetical protein
MTYQLSHYLDSLTIPWLSWLPLDVNEFVSKLKAVLSLPQYQESNMLRAMLKEKDQLIAVYEKKAKQNSHPITLEAAVEKKINEVTDEVQLLRSENEFLYKAIADLDKKLKETECVIKQSLKKPVSTPKKPQDDKPSPTNPAASVLQSKLNSLSWSARLK